MAAAVSKFSRDGLAVLAVLTATLLWAPPGPECASPQPDVQAQLRAAVRKGDVDITRALLDHGADPNAPDPVGMTPLHYAAYRGDVTMATLLLDRGARAGKADGEGITPLQAAAFEGRLAVAKLLVQAGAPLDTPDRAGLTPLHCAAASGRLDLVQLLVEAGANPAARALDGRTAADLAAAAKAAACEAYLRPLVPSPMPRKARVVITDDNLVHVPSPEDYEPLAPLPDGTQASGQNGAGGPLWARMGGQTSQGESKPRPPAPEDPVVTAARIHQIQQRQVELMTRIPKLRQDCQNHQRLGQALDTNQAIDADLKELAEKYISGSPSTNYEGGVNREDLAKSQEASRKAATQFRVDTSSACDGLKYAEQEMRNLDRELAYLRGSP